MAARVPSVPPSVPLAPLPGMTPLPSGQVKQGDWRTALVAVVDPEICVGCGACEEVCPAGAIAVHEVARIDRAKCTGCAHCIAACPHRAIALKEA